MTKTPPEFSTEEGKRASISFLEPIISFLKEEQDECLKISKEIGAFFSDVDFWKKGMYSEKLMDQFCLLLFKLTTLEQMAPSKQGVNDDISTFMKLINDHDMEMNAREVRIWIADTRVISNTILNEFNSIDNFQHLLNIFNLFYKYIRQKIEDDNYICHDMLYVYINALIFFYRLYERTMNREIALMEKEKKNKRKYLFKQFSEDQKNFMKQLVEKIYYCFLNLLQLQHLMFQNVFLRFLKSQKVMLLH